MTNRDSRRCVTSENIIRIQISNAEPYGVVTQKEKGVTDIVEEPEYEMRVNAGSHFIEPDVLEPIDDGIAKMPRFLLMTMGEGLSVGATRTSKELIDVAHFEVYQTVGERIKGAGAFE